MSVKCSECGFLSLRLDDSKHLIEAHEKTRRTGEVLANNEIIPACFVRSANLSAELAGRKATYITAREIIQSDRECNQFIEWQQGFSPKEHSEMLQQKMLLEWQRQMAEDERQWRENQAATARAWRKEDQAAAETAMKAQRYSGWAIAVWTLVSAGITWLIAIATLAQTR
jgi:hypothetical protein